MPSQQQQQQQQSQRRGERAIWHVVGEEGQKVITIVMDQHSKMEPAAIGPTAKHHPAGPGQWTSSKTLVIQKPQKTEKFQRSSDNCL